MEIPAPSSGRRISKHWKTAAGLSGVLVYFFVLSHHGLGAYFTGDDVMNLVGMHGYWRWPWWRNALEALMVVTPVYRPMGDVFYRLLYGVFGFNPLPFRAASYALMVLNLGLFFRFALLVSRSREAALLGTLVFSFHAALSDLYLSTGTVYDILCVTFTLAAFVTYASVHTAGRELQAKHIVILLLLYGGALDSKEMAASLPVGLVLYEVILVRRITLLRLWRRALPVLLVGILTVAVLAVKIPALSDNPLYRPQHSPSYVLSNASQYVSLLLFRDQPLGPFWLIVLALVSAIACLAARRPVALFGLCYGFTALLPLVTVPSRGGFVLYLPLVGFALFFGDLLAAAAKAVRRFLPSGARTPFWTTFSQAALFVALAAGLYVIQSRHWRVQSANAEPLDTAMRETVRLIRAAHPTLPAGTRLLFLDDPLPKYQPALVFLIQAAYHDPSLGVERQNNVATPIDPAEYAIFDYLVSIHDGKWQEQRLPPIRWQGPEVPVTFIPSTVEPGRAIQVRVGNYSDAAVDIEYRTTRRFSHDNGVALRWTNLNTDGIATIQLPLLEEPASVEITAVRVNGDPWRKAHGGFIIRGSVIR
jgi:hypothetical protein